MGKVGIIRIYWRGILMSFLRSIFKRFHSGFLHSHFDSNMTQLMTQLKPYNK